MLNGTPDITAPSTSIDSRREIPLTKGYVALVDEEDYERISAYKWFACVKPHGVYAARRTGWVDGRRGYIPMHRAVLGDPPAEQLTVDHIDPNRTLDNRRSNLRWADHRGQMANRRRPSNNTSGHKGVSWNSNAGKWMAQIQHCKKSINLGYYDTPELASKAYAAASAKLQGEFARIA